MCHLCAWCVDRVSVRGMNTAVLTFDADVTTGQVARVYARIDSRHATLVHCHTFPCVSVYSSYKLTSFTLT